MAVQFEETCSYFLFLAVCLYFIKIFILLMTTIKMEIKRMAFSFENLDQITRRLMIDEVDYDLKNGNLYISPRLTLKGTKEYAKLLKNASQTGNEITLANDLRTNGIIKPFELRRTKTGTTTAKVPITAPETLAEGEFNRFYIRALCRRVIEEKTGKLEVYRAKQVSRPRSSSQAKIGQIIDPFKLLADLRNNPGVDTALGLPAGPNQV